MSSSLDMYRDEMEDGEKGYDKDEIRKRLEPHLNYLRTIHKYYERPIKFDWKRRKQPRSGGALKVDKTPLGGSRDTNVWIRVSGLSPEHEQYLFKSDNVQDIVDDDSNPSRWKQTIRILERDVERRELKMERVPRSKKPCIFRDTYGIYRQIKAIEVLIHRPNRRQHVLLNLFQDRDRVDLDGVKTQHVDRWFVLTKKREGVEQQRKFVRRALGTPDFAFLEGPPGSGKTTTLCELVHQLVAEGRRVLFCASTHVAVDNLLEKISAGYTTDDSGSNLIPLRIGNSEKISAAVSPYRYDEFVRTVEKKIRTHLSKQKHMSKAQKSLSDVLNSGKMGEVARDCANLVCGTTVGILQHPDIDVRNGSPEPLFDVMILDEASKTTFQEFLVPALYARRWIIVGDTKQLAPHTDQEAIGLHVGLCIGEREGTVCTDAFLTAKKKYSAVIVATDADLKREYRDQCEKLGIKPHDADASRGWKGSGIVVGSASSLSRLDVGVIQGMRGRNGIVVRHRDRILDELGGDVKKTGAWKGVGRSRQEPDDSMWDRQVTWRLVALSGGVPDGGTTQKVKEDFEMLMPHDTESASRVDLHLKDVKKIAFPSILELLQRGYGRQDDMAIMTRGMLRQDFERRHVLLEWQHRMHFEIAEFSRKYVYKGKALGTPEYMSGERDWTYKRYGNRMVWIDVTGKGGADSSPAESERIANETDGFSKWARDHPRGDGAPWEIAVLSFYTNQRECLQKTLGKRFAPTGEYSFSIRHKGREFARAEVRTVDSFQGHEADVVFLSVARQYPTLFLENPNRLNVAITRARYQNVIVGNREAMGKSDSLMGELARHAHTAE